LFELFQRWLQNSINLEPFVRTQHRKVLLDDVKTLLPGQQVNSDVDTVEELQNELFGLLGFDDVS
jgi:hypothetical protein